MTLRQFRDLLLTVTPNVYHYVTKTQPDTFIRWQEYGGKTLSTSNRHTLRVARIQVDMFTKTEYDPLLDKLLRSLAGARGVAYSEPITDYEPDTGYIHHSVECEVILRALA